MTLPLNLQPAPTPRCIRDRRRGFSLVEVMTAATIGIVLAAFAIPKMTSSLQGFRTGGDARTVNSDVTLAKMRASSGYTHARVYADLLAQTVEVDVWNTSTSTWGADTQNGTAQSLSRSVTFGYGTSIASPPPNTQSTIAEAPLCYNAANTATVANTACVVFNSRGVPIDSTSSPTGSDALYVTDGTSVYGVTVTATGSIRTWRSEASPASCSAGSCWKKR